MKRTFIAALFALALLAAPKIASANVYDRTDGDHPLRYVAYLVHPLGVAVDYALLQPIHRLVSLPNASKWFGYDSDCD